MSGAGPRRKGRAARFPDLGRDARGGATLEFVIVFTALTGLLIFAMQVAAAHFVQVSALDAARRAARTAATLPVIHCAALRGADGLRRHALAPGAAAIPPAGAARACLNAPSPCAPLPGVWRCGLGAGSAPDPACDPDLLERLREAARAPGLRLAGLTVSYRDSRLGELGGPVIPLVSVTLRPKAPDFANPFVAPPDALAPATAAAVGEVQPDSGGGAPSC